MVPDLLRSAVGQRVDVAILEALIAQVLPRRLRVQAVRLPRDVEHIQRRLDLVREGHLPAVDLGRERPHLVARRPAVRHALHRDRRELVRRQRQLRLHVVRVARQPLLHERAHERRRFLGAVHGRQEAVDFHVGQRLRIDAQARELLRQVVQPLRPRAQPRVQVVLRFEEVAAKLLAHKVNHLVLGQPSVLLLRKGGERLAQHRALRDHEVVEALHAAALEEARTADVHGPELGRQRRVRIDAAARDDLPDDGLRALTHIGDRATANVVQVGVEGDFEGVNFLSRRIDAAISSARCFWRGERRFEARAARSSLSGFTRLVFIELLQVNAVGFEGVEDRLVLIDRRPLGTIDERLVDRHAVAHVFQRARQVGVVEIDAGLGFQFQQAAHRLIVVGTDRPGDTAGLQRHAFAQRERLGLRLQRLRIEALRCGLRYSAGLHGRHLRLRDRRGRLGRQRLREVRLQRASEDFFQRRLQRTHIALLDAGLR